MKMLEINGKAVKPAELDFNAMCDMEDMGVSIFEADNKGLSSLRAYLAISEGISSKEAGIEIGAHLASGGNLDALATAFSDAVKESTFFQTAPKDAEEKTPKKKA